jgi:molybdopterin-guanine dinucleotide biosynthesis protein A
VKRREQVAAFILAGGASSRMGREKALLDFGGVPLVVHTARLVEPLVACVTLVGRPSLPVDTRIQTIADHDSSSPGETESVRRGPLAGIAAALTATLRPWNLILACDLPYLSVEWLDWLLSRAEDSDRQIVIPHGEHGLEPLAAVYRRECGGPLAADLERGTRRVIDAIANLSMDVVQEREWQHLDPHRMILKNMNTPGDYEEALEWRSAVARDALDK